MGRTVSESSREFDYLLSDRTRLGQTQLLTRSVRVEGCTILLGVDPEGQLRLLLPISTNEVRPWSTAGLLLRVVRQSDPQGDAFLELACTRPELNGTFCLLVDDLIDHIRAAREADLYVTVKRVLQDWEQLFASQSNVLSLNDQVGLVAELHLLERIAGISSPDRALASWRAAQPGPSLRDFAGAGLQVEVKALTSRSGGSVSVHGFDQLDPTVAGLHLHVARVEVGDGEETLHDVVLHLLRHGFPAPQLMRALRQRGYTFNPESPDPSEQRLRVMECFTWELSPDMPLLSRSDLPASKRNSIEDVQYRVALSALGDPLPEAAADDVLARLAECTDV